MKVRLTLGCQMLAAAVLAAAPALAEDHEQVANPDVKCLKCHTKNLKKKLEDGERMSLRVEASEFEDSVHSVIGCTGCHRDIGKSKHPSREPIASARDYSLAQNENCQHCHEAKFTAYEGSIHASLARDGDLHGAIAGERERVAGLRARADIVIDTTELNVHDLRRHLIDYIGRDAERPSMVVRLLSFGFKYGIPAHADLVLDLRFLPNPHFVEALRPKTGMDPEVSKYVLDAPQTQEFLRRLRPLLDFSLPQHAREGKAYLTVAFGCTGGRHRSVAIAEELGRQLGSAHEVVVSHRDSERAPS